MSSANQFLSNKTLVNKLKFHNFNISLSCKNYFKYSFQYILIKEKTSIFRTYCYCIVRNECQFQQKKSKIFNKKEDINVANIVLTHNIISFYQYVIKEMNLLVGGLWPFGVVNTVTSFLTFKFWFRPRISIYCGIKCSVACEWKRPTT